MFCFSLSAWNMSVQKALASLDVLLALSLLGMCLLKRTMDGYYVLVSLLSGIVEMLKYLFWNPLFKIIVWLTDVLSLSLCIEYGLFKSYAYLTMFWTLSSLGSSKCSKIFSGIHFQKGKFHEACSVSLLPRRHIFKIFKWTFDVLSVFLFSEIVQILETLFLAFNFSKSWAENGCFCFSSAQKTYIQNVQVNLRCSVLLSLLSLNIPLRSRASSFKDAQKLEMFSGIGSCSKKLEVLCMFCFSSAQSTYICSKLTRKLPCFVFLLLKRHMFKCTMQQWDVLSVCSVQTTTCALLF
jgi:hypothetical protein